MSLRHPLLTAALAFGLLAGCSRNATPPPTAESGATPTAQMEAPANDKPTPPPSDAEPVGEMPSGGTAAATDSPTERGPAVFFVKNSGVRCMTTPCPTFVATRPDRPGDEPLQVHDLDLSALNVSDEKRASLEEATFRDPGLKVQATVDTVPNAGPAGAATVLRVSQVVEK